MLSYIAKASLRSEILINFDCYVDTEVGLIRLIRENYLDERVFNKDKILGDIRSIILALIERKEFNPLYLFANEGIDKKDLDDYYEQFMAEEYDKILSLSVTTELKSLLNLIKTEKSIHITFLCNDIREADILMNDNNIKEWTNITLSDNKIKDFSVYTAYYFKYINNNIFKYIYPYKTYYFSNYRINFDDNFNPINDDLMDAIVYTGGEVEILDLYNKSYLEGV